MTARTDPLLGPVSEKERVTELDALRGIALFGVLTMNLVAFAGPGVGITEAQAAALASAAVDETTYWAVRWLIGDKANTVFATLFGLGFYLQMQRAEGRPGFEARYRRRLAWLLVFGILNTLFLWAWDILNLYAVAGFALLAMRRWSTRALVWFGGIAALYSDKLQEWLIDRLNLTIPSSEAYFSDAGVIERQTVLANGDYIQIVGYFANFTLIDWLLSGLMVALLIYALGRFALGAAIGRSGILNEIPRYVPMLRRVAWTAIPAGLLFGLVIRLVYTEAWQPLGKSDDLVSLAQILRSPAALVLAAGYCAAVVVAMQRAWGRRLFGWFGPVGQMALTNYLAQGLLYGFVLTGVGPGLALAGKIGSFAVFIACVLFFAAQVLFSHWWLARYRFGPMEWLWRALTYGERPAFRRREDVAAAIA